MISPNLAIAGYALKGVTRDRFTWFILAAMAVSFALATVISAGALTEKPAFAIVMTAGGLRLLTSISLAVLICFHIRRCFDNREMLTILAAPISRFAPVLGFSLGYGVTSLLLGFTAGLVLIPTTLNVAGGLSALALWTATLMIELLIIAVFAVFIALVLRSAVVATLAVCGFIVLARLSGVMLGIADNTILDDGGILMTFALKSATVIALLLPRFDLLAQSAWFTTAPSALSFAPSQLLGFVLFPLFFILAAGVDITRRNSV